MRLMGVPVLPVLAAAIVIYAIGFVIYGLLFSELWMQLAGYTEAEMEGEMWRMALSPIMPILTAIGLAVVFRWAAVDGLGRALKVAFLLWLFFAFVVLMYGFAYSDERTGLLALDCIHLLLGYLTGGAVLALWPKPRVQAGHAAL